MKLPTILNKHYFYRMAREDNGQVFMSGVVSVPLWTSPRSLTGLIISFAQKRNTRAVIDKLERIK